VNSLKIDNRTVEAVPISIEITLENGDKLQVEPGTTPRMVMESKGIKADGILAAALDDIAIDLNRPLHSSGKLRFLTFNDPKGRDVYWHSASHLMAQAVIELYPGTKLGFGPAVDGGFYYDFDIPGTFSADDLPRIEEKMREIIQRNIEIHRRELTHDEARKLFEERGEPLKVEHIDDIDHDLSIYTQGEFLDLCRGPHVPSTGYLGEVKLLSVAGAYWKGDETRPMLQRIYGTAFPRKQELDEYLNSLEEARKRDHRKIGKQLDLFSFHPEAPGFPFWHPKGKILLEQIFSYWRKVHRRNGYLELQTPIILSEDLWRRSGHWDNYRDNMYFTKIDERDFAVKPMNCPGHLLVYKTRQWSYRDLPLKWCELGLVHRHEKAGTLHGLFRVRMMTQDDAHIFCTPEQAEEEVIGCINILTEIYSTFGFTDYQIELSTRPTKSIGSDEMWERGEATLRNALSARGISYEINPGEGAFYGPKIDFHVLDCLKRPWQCGTIQIDFSMPQRFELEYIDADGERKTPVMLHRALLGSLERWVGILIEHYGGDFPLWLAPVQVEVMPITDSQNDYAARVTSQLVEAGIRAECDFRNEKIGYKIREAETGKIPCMVIIGAREADENMVTLRRRKIGDQGKMALPDLIDLLTQEIQGKKAYSEETAR
jgi:threonyl-tRNA synthetase